jgi:transposase-like protein
MRNKKEAFDYEALKKKTWNNFARANIYSANEVPFAPKDPQQNNRKNGYNTKLLKTGAGSIELDTPRDRNSDFSPEIVKKRETILAISLESKIIGIYGLGMSLRDISAHN